MNAPLFGIDLGGTKTEGVVMTRTGHEILRHRVPTVPGSYAATIATVRDLVTHLQARSGARCDRIGVGIPGSLSPRTGRVRNANSTWINGERLGGDLETALGRPVRVENDANCLALSEARDGAARNARLVFAVILGTGVGGGLVVDGRLVAGAHGLGGEWGHMPLVGETGGPGCYCGRSGCVETYLSGPGLLRDYRKGGGSRGAASVEALVALAASGEAAARAALRRHGERLARALGALVNVIDPDCFVIGGGLSNIEGLVEGLPAAITPHVFAPSGEAVRIDVSRARWGDSSGVRGAARLWQGVGA